MAKFLLSKVTDNKLWSAIILALLTAGISVWTRVSALEIKQAMATTAISEKASKESVTALREDVTEIKRDIKTLLQRVPQKD